MAQYTFRINNSHDCHEKIIQKCHELVTHFIANPNDELIFDLSDLSFIYPDYALLILCSFKYLESKNIFIRGNIKLNRNSAAIKYLSRMNFFENINVDLPDGYKRSENVSLVELQMYNDENQNDVCNSLMTVLKKNSVIQDDVFAGLDYCLNEILDNVLLHSNTGQGWVVAQYFKHMNSIRLMVCDFGIGIQEALSINHNYTEKEALKECIIEGVTNGKGQGHGLFATSKFISLNKGWLSIISGNTKLDYQSDDSVALADINKWQGTSVYLRINTNIDVDYRQFTSRYYDYKNELFEELFQ